MSITIIEYIETQDIIQPSYINWNVTLLNTKFNTNYMYEEQLQKYDVFSPTLLCEPPVDTIPENTMHFQVSTLRW